MSTEKTMDHADTCTLSSLLERVEKATGPDRELDAALYDHFCSHATQEWTEWDSRHDFTHSIDTAIALVNEKLPGCQWSLEADACWIRVLTADDVDEFQGNFNCRGGEATALAICAALLRALIAQQESAALSKALGTPVSGPHDAALTQSSDAEMGEKT